MQRQEQLEKRTRLRIKRRRRRQASEHSSSSSPARVRRPLGTAAKRVCDRKIEARRAVQGGRRAREGHEADVSTRCRGRAHVCRAPRSPGVQHRGDLCPPGLLWSCSGRKQIQMPWFVYCPQPPTSSRYSMFRPPRSHTSAVRRATGYCGPVRGQASLRLKLRRSVV